MKTLRINSYYSKKAENMADNAIRFYFNGVYLHGEVEQLCHYDICYPDNPHDFEEGIRAITTKYYGGGEEDYEETENYLFLDGIFPCIVDNKYDCTAFLWYDHRMVAQGRAGASTMRGLIVLNSDTKFLEDAREKYNERALYL